MEENKVEKRQIRYSTMSNVPAAALYIWWSGFYVINNMQEKQKQALI